MSDIKVDKYYKHQAKELTDMLFDKGFLNDSLARESINWLEDFIGFTLQSRCEMAVKGAMLIASLRAKVV